MPRTRTWLVVGLVTLLLSSEPAAAMLLPRVPTQFSGARALEVRAPVIGWTGDGTGYLGGFSGHRSIKMPSRSHVRWAGHIHWSRWSSTRAQGSGAAWLNNGIPNDAQGTFSPYPMTIQLSDPVDGVFTHMTVHYRYQGVGQTVRLHAGYAPPSSFGPGYWSWA